jgi:hypothetical protein
MYKQRPAMPALIAAACVMLFGGFVVYYLYRRVDDGDANSASVLFAVCLTCGLVGTLVILAFARYQFTHLWKHPDPAFSKKASRNRKRGRL